MRQYFLLFIAVFVFLESETDVQEEIECVSVVVLRVSRELVRACHTCGIEVVAVLFVAARSQVAVVGDVVKGEVDADAFTSLQADISSY